MTNDNDNKCILGGASKAIRLKNMFICIFSVVNFVEYILLFFLFSWQLELQKPQGGGEKIEEDFTLARLFISKMKSEAKTLMQHCSQLETFQAENNKKLDEAESQLSSCKLLVQQVSL